MTDRLTINGQAAVILNQSAFYPTSGGQPHDQGTLNDIPVLDVTNDPDTGAVIHILAANMASDTVSGHIDWGRRFDLMQQHTGQHILSQACLQTSAAATVGFHLSQDYATIDLADPDLENDTLYQAESLANQIICENRDIVARFVTSEELVQIPLRKQPVVQGPIRIVEVRDFDWSACGGTHVWQAGEVGLIKVVRTERRKEFLRVTFLCGQRALYHYRHINDQIHKMALHLSVSVDDAFETLVRQSERSKEAQKTVEKLNKDLLAFEAQALIDNAAQYNGVSIMRQIFDDKEIGEVQQLARAIIQRPGHIALLGLTGEKGQLLFARSDDLEVDMTALLRNVGKIIGGGGGGSPQLAQGGGPKADQVSQAITAAQTQIEHLLDATDSNTDTPHE